MRILISHRDLDGIGVIVLRDYFNLPFDAVYSWDYGFIEIPECKKIIDTADEIIMADLSIPEEDYDELIKAGKHIEIYDHHDTASWLDTKQGSFHDEERCGTKIFFEEYVLPRVGRYKPIVKQFVDLVDVYDRWVLESPLRKESENLQRVWTAYANWNCPDTIMQHDRFITQMCKKFDSMPNFGWNITEQSYIDTALQKEETSYQQALNIIQDRIDNQGKVFGIWRAWGRISITASRILRETDKYDYLICLQDSPDNWGKVSVRCLEEKFDVTTLASVGGHKAAGGTTISVEEANDLWSKPMCFKLGTSWKEGESPIEMCNSF